MTIRKNFNFDEETAQKLERLAKNAKKTQTEMVKKAIDLLEREEKKKMRLEALEKLAGSLTGKIGDIDIKEAKSQYIMEKYGY